MSQEELENTVNRIVLELKKKDKKEDITYADIFNYIWDRCEIPITSEIATKIAQICNDKIMEAGGNFLDLPITKERKFTKAFIGTIFK